MSDIPNCPECDSEYSYENGALFSCPDCGHEWAAGDDIATPEEQNDIVKDAHGNVLENGDAVKLTKDLKVKGTSTTLKIGTKVKSIRLTPGADHDIDCTIEGIGPMKLKSQFVKKA